MTTNPFGNAWTAIDSLNKRPINLARSQYFPRIVRLLGEQGSGGCVTVSTSQLGVAVFGSPGWEDQIKNVRTEMHRWDRAGFVHFTYDWHADRTTICMRDRGLRAAKALRSVFKDGWDFPLPPVFDQPQAAPEPRAVVEMPVTVVEPDMDRLADMILERMIDRLSGRPAPDLSARVAELEGWQARVREAVPGIDRLLG